MQLPDDIPDNARRATLKMFADLIAEGGAFDTPLHRLAVAATTSAAAEPEFWAALRAMPEPFLVDFGRKIEAKQSAIPQLAREYTRRGIV